MASAVLGALRQRAVTEVVAWDTPLLQRIGLPQAVQGEGIVWTGATPDTDPAAIRAAAATAGAGVTTIRLAVADTGTLVMSSGPGMPRSITLLPPLHIAVMTEDQLLADTGTYFQQLSTWAKAGQMPAALYMITGPSKTRDIEHIAVRKVHGPGELIVIVLPPDR